jgi:hypothetical protein
MGAIEQKYNELRGLARDLRGLASGQGNVSRPAACAFQQRVCVLASELARAAWPELRAELASRSDELPDGPVRYDTTGYTCHSLEQFQPALSVCGSRLPEQGEGQVLAAIERARAEYAQKADRAEALYERYRLAVAQGVAVEPLATEEIEDFSAEGMP